MTLIENSHDIMAVLKAETIVQHQTVERLLPFFDPEFSLAAYTQTIALFLGFYEPIEQQLSSVAGWEEIGIDLKARSRTHLLCNDLAALNYSQSRIADLARCRELPPIHNLFDGLGCLYVLEGSTLGGQLIAREVARRFSLREDSGAAFFYSYGAKVGSMWMQFCESVRKTVKSPGEFHAAVRAAETTFTAFSTWIGRQNKNGH